MSDEPPIDEDVWAAHVREQREREARGEPEEEYEPDEEDLRRWAEELFGHFDKWAADESRAREGVLAQIARSFLARDEPEIAVALTGCDLALAGKSGELVPLTGDRLFPQSVVVTLHCPIEALNAVRFGADSPSHEHTLRAMVEANLPPGLTLHELVVRAKPMPVSENWREEITQSLKGTATNQGTPMGGSPVVTYNGLNYRSQAEVALARELEKRSVLFFPNSRASRGKTTREPDFLIVHTGRVGIIEVDGPHHRGKAADDHMRDLFFEHAGIRVKHFNHEDVRSNPAQVVDVFLRLLLGSANGD